MNYLKKKRESLKAQMGNQKGLTMIELMFVLLVIAIIIAVVVGIGNNSADKARETGVRSDMKNFLDTAEIYLATEVGEDTTYVGLLKDLDDAGVKDKKDPWKQDYEVGLEQDPSESVSRATYISSGKDAKLGLTVVEPVDPDTNRVFTTPVPAEVKDNYTGVVYYQDGKTARCTVGFEKNEIDTVTQVFGEQTDWTCGEDVVTATP